MSQLEAIQTFQAITETDNEAQARDFLDRSDWDVVAAVNLFYAQSTQDQALPLHENPIPAAPILPDLPPAEPVPERPRGLIGRTWTGLCSLGTGTIALIAGLFRSLDECQSAGPFGSASEQETAGEVLALIREISAEMREMTVETHGYRRAMVDAAMRKRTMIAYLHNDHFTLGYLREVVFTTATVTLLQDNFTLLLLDPGHPDYSHLIREAGRPFIPIFVCIYPVSRDQQAVLDSLAPPLVESDTLDFLENSLNQAEYIARELEDEAGGEVDRERIRRDRL